MGMTQKQKAVLEAHQTGMSQRAIAQELGLSRRSVRSHLQAAKRHLASPLDQDPAVLKAMEAFGTEVQPDTIWLKNKEYSVQLRPKKDQEQDFLERVSEAFRDIPQAPTIQAPHQVDPDLMVVYPIFDAHLGMRAHAEISGEEIDLRRGADRIKRGISAVMAGAPAAKRAVIINGGDFTHQTDDQNKTRRSGHVLDVDGRNVMTVLEAIEVISACIEMALTKHEEVEYYSVPGNHDPQNWETILIGLRERYRSHDRVRISFSLKEVSVVTHGQVAIFVHHGDKRTPKDLAMFCAAEFPEVWGQTRYRILMTGHLHHTKSEEFPGILWMQLPAVGARDHHAAGGYQSNSLMTAIGFDLVSEATRNTVKL